MCGSKNKYLMMIVASLTLVGAGCSNEYATNIDNNNQNTTVPAVTEWLPYTSKFQFQISKPKDAVVIEDKDDTNGSGRIGTVMIDDKETNAPSADIYVFVYKDKISLEKDTAGKYDATTIDSAMAHQGLSKTTTTVDARPATVYSGIRTYDTLHGKGSQPYVAVEFIGDAYAYLIEFNSISADPKDPKINRYLSSFTADFTE